MDPARKRIEPVLSTPEPAPRGGHSIERIPPTSTVMRASGSSSYSLSRIRTLIPIAPNSWSLICRKVIPHFFLRGNSLPNTVINPYHCQYLYCPIVEIRLNYLRYRVILVTHTRTHTDRKIEIERERERDRQTDRHQASHYLPVHMSDEINSPTGILRCTDAAPSDAAACAGC